MNAATDFTGEGLSFSVVGAGVSVDPATGVLRIPTDALRDGVEVTVSATNSGGVATTRFRVTVAAPPPAAVGTLADVSYTQGSGVRTVATQGAFSGAGLTYALLAAPAGVTIDAATGVVSVPTTASLAAATVTMRAQNASGAATQSFKVTVAVAAPTAVGTLADVSYTQGSGVRTVATQGAFSGAGLTYALLAAPAGVTINAGSGLVSIPTTALLAAATVTVRAQNASGAATPSFKVTVARWRRRRRSGRWRT